MPRQGQPVATLGSEHELSLGRLSHEPVLVVVQVGLDHHEGSADV
jgi:hypothetical protein